MMMPIDSGDFLIYGISRMSRIQNHGRLIPLAAVNHEARSGFYLTLLTNFSRVSDKWLLVVDFYICFHRNSTELLVGEEKHRRLELERQWKLDSDSADFTTGIYS